MVTVPFLKDIKYNWKNIMNIPKILNEKKGYSEITSHYSLAFLKTWKDQNNPGGISPFFCLSTCSGQLSQSADDCPFS